MVEVCLSRVVGLCYHVTTLIPRRLPHRQQHPRTSLYNNDSLDLYLPFYPYLISLFYGLSNFVWLFSISFRLGVVHGPNCQVVETSASTSIRSALLSITKLDMVNVQVSGSSGFQIPREIPPMQTTSQRSKWQWCPEDILWLIYEELDPESTGPKITQYDYISGKYKQVPSFKTGLAAYSAVCKRWQEFFEPLLYHPRVPLQNFKNSASQRSHTAHRFPYRA